MGAIIFFYQFWCLFIYCCHGSKDFLWLIYDVENCQGILLNWCLVFPKVKHLINISLRKHFQSDILGSSEIEDTVLAHKLCLHANLESKDGLHPLINNVDPVLLHYPLRKIEIPLSHIYNIFGKTCYNYQCRHCRIYHYQSHNNFGTRIKTFSVKLLDFSFCQHQILHLTESKHLCIWTPAQEDCWVQLKISVSYVFVNDWELVGFVIWPSGTCNDALLIIKMTPNKACMKKNIKTFKKTMGSIIFLPCSFYSGRKHGPLNRLSLMRPSFHVFYKEFILQSHRQRLSTFPLIRKRRSDPLTTSGSNNKNSLTGRRHLQVLLQSKQLTVASRLSMIWNSLNVKPWDTSERVDLWSNPVTDTALHWVLSDFKNLPTADIPGTKNHPQKDVMKYQHQAITNSVRFWDQSLTGTIGFKTLPLVNATESWFLFSSERVGSHVPPEITTVQTQFHSTKFFLHDLCKTRVWQDVIPIVKSWTFSMPEKTEKIMWMQTREQNLKTNLNNIAYNGYSALKPLTSHLCTWLNLIIHGNQLQNPSTLNVNRYEDHTAVHNIKTWLEPTLNIFQSEEPIQKDNEYDILSGSTSTQFWTSSALIMPFMRTSSAANSIRSWAQLKARMIKLSSPMGERTLLSIHVNNELKTQRNTGDTTWLLHHSLTNVIEIFTSSTVDVIRPKTQNERDTAKTLTQSVTQARRSLTGPGYNAITSQLWIMATRILPWIRPKLQSARPWIHIKKDKRTLWTQLNVDTIRSWTFTENDIIRPWNHNDADVARTWSWTTSDQKEPTTLTNFQTHHPWVQPEGYTMGLWSTQPKATEILPWAKPNTPNLRLETQSSVNTVSQWRSPRVDMVKYKLQTQYDTLRTWTKPNSQILISWPQIEADRVRSSFYIQDDIFTPQIGKQFQNPYSQKQPDNHRTGLRTESGTNYVKLWFKTRADKITLWTKPIAKTANHWIWSRVDIASLFTKPRNDLEKAWIKLKTYAFRPSVVLGIDEVHFWTPTESHTIKPCIKSESGIIISWTQNDAGTLTLQTQDECAGVNPQTKVETETVISSINHKIPVVNYWIDVLAKSIKTLANTEFLEQKFSTHLGTSIVPLWAQVESPAINFWTQFVSDTLTQETHVEPLEIFLSTGCTADIVTPRTQYKSLQANAHSTNDGVTLWSSVDYVLVSLWTQPVPDTLLKWTQTELLANSSWELTVSHKVMCHSHADFSKVETWTDTETDTMTPKIHTESPVITRTQSTTYTATFWTKAGSSLLYPLGFLSTSFQKHPISKVLEEITFSDDFTFLHGNSDRVLTNKPYLRPESQSKSGSYKPEQDPLKLSKLSVSLAECRLSWVWKESLQSFQLFQTAVVSHETTECGLHPGLVLDCPNCWEAEVGEFPWMVSVQLSFSHFCAGSILNEQWILTTARCANFIKNSEPLALVQVGLVDLKDANPAQNIGIYHSIPYLGPKGPSGPGLIYLKKPLHFQPLVLPICLQERFETARGKQLSDCWIPSWSLMRGSPGILQKRPVSILQISTCDHSWPKQSKFTFCVEAKKATGEAGCKGDLGSPLVCYVQQQKVWFQVGILSHFDENCTKPYVFTKVSPFLFWIQGVTKFSHAPWSQQWNMTASGSTFLSVSTSKNASNATPPGALLQPQFISLPKPQSLAGRISLRYAMPWQGMIISCGSQICSGSIVSSTWVLTSAHCVRNMNPADTVVIFGLRHPGSSMRVVKVSTILLHERFQLVSGTARNDLALLLLHEVQTFSQLLAPLGPPENLNSSECWLSGPRILTKGKEDERPEMLHMKIIGDESCEHIYARIGSSVFCFMTKAKSSHAKLEQVSPGSALMCRELSGNGSWRQIGLTSLQDQVTIVGPHVSWILYTSAKTGHPINQALMPWVEKPISSSLHKLTTTLTLSSIMIIALQRYL